MREWRWKYYALAFYLGTWTWRRSRKMKWAQKRKRKQYCENRNHIYMENVRKILRALHCCSKHAMLHVVQQSLPSPPVPLRISSWRCGAPMEPKELQKREQRVLNCAICLLQSSSRTESARREHTLTFANINYTLFFGVHIHACAPKIQQWNIRPSWRSEEGQNERKKSCVRQKTNSTRPGGNHCLFHDEM